MPGTVVGSKFQIDVYFVGDTELAQFTFVSPGKPPKERKKWMYGMINNRSRLHPRLKEAAKQLDQMVKDAEIPGYYLWNGLRREDILGVMIPNRDHDLVDRITRMLFECVMPDIN